MNLLPVAPIDTGATVGTLEGLVRLEVQGFLVMFLSYQDARELSAQLYQAALEAQEYRRGYTVALLNDAEGPTQT